MNKKPKDVTRYIKRSVSEMLWGRAAGRCQFDGCNKQLYKSSVTQEQVNIAQKAHIYSFSENGPRGWGPFITNRKAINNIDNLMLMCHQCHHTIDEDKMGEKYSGELLQKWKEEHEERTILVTGIKSDKKSHVVFYKANIGNQKIQITKEDAFLAMFPNRYPASTNPINISMNWSEDDSKEEFFEIEKRNLKREFDNQIVPIYKHNQNNHFSLFAFAPIPLLIYLGTLFNERMDIDVFQPIREPKGWQWQEYPDNFKFIINKPSDKSLKPVLVISLSAKIDEKRITSVLGKDVSIWEITVPEEFIENDNIRNVAQLSQMRNIVRKAINDIQEYSGMIPLSIFPAMAISTSIELGRVRMPKANMPWVIYDQNNKEGRFIKTLTIGDEK